MTAGSSVKPDDSLTDPEEDEPAMARPVVDLGSAFSETPLYTVQIYKQSSHYVLPQRKHDTVVCVHVVVCV